MVELLYELVDGKLFGFVGSKCQLFLENLDVDVSFVIMYNITVIW